MTGAPSTGSEVAPWPRPRPLLTAATVLVALGMIAAAAWWFTLQGNR